MGSPASLGGCCADAREVVSLDVLSRPLILASPRGTRLPAHSDLIFADEGGLTLDPKGFGSITDLSVAAANGVGSLIEVSEKAA